MTIKTFRKFLFLLLIQPYVFNITAQTTLTGKVLDQKTKAPIPYASVYVENTFTGKAAAEDGTFSFEIKEGHQGDVIVRAIGYDAKVLKQGEFTPQGLDIYLAPTSFSIQEVEATAKKALSDPVKIVKKAIKRIPENMATDYTELEGTYHQAFQDYETDRLLDANQVKVKVGLQGVKIKQKTDSIWQDAPLSDNEFWESFRYNDDVLLPQYQIPDYGTDHIQCLLRMDPVRNHATPTFDFVERLDKDFIDNHYFHLDTIGVYNGENVYHIRVYLLNEIRFSRVNVLDGDFTLAETYSKFYPEYKRKLSIHPNFSYLKTAYNGKHASIPIGRLMISTQDFSIVYFEYANGFGNDRYKFIAEYTKMKGKYYPSKLYFGNKYRMKNHPDFTQQGENTESGLKCLMSKKHCKEIINKYGQTHPVEVEKTIRDYTIKCPSSGYLKNGVEVRIDSLIPYTRIIEEIQDSLEFADYNKYIHHRYVEFEFNDADVEPLDKGDFYRFYYPLGDKSFHWNAYQLRKERHSTSGFYRVYVGLNTLFYSVIPVPFTSKDEFIHINRAPNDTTLYNKNYLIKGIATIVPD